MSPTASSGLNENETTSLLSRLCIELGFCLQGSAVKHFYQSPPADIKTFTDAVFIAEGINPVVADKKLYSKVRAVVTSSFQRAGE